MLEEISLSKKTIRLIGKVTSLNNCPIIIPDSFINASNLNSVELFAWLATQQLVNEKYKYLLESLYVSMLMDLHESIPEKKTKKAEEKSGWTDKLKFVLLAIAGTIFFGCEGFDGIMSILSITSLPTFVIFAIGLAFSLCSIAVFYACDLVEISKNLGVDLSSAPKMVTIYLQEIEVIQDLRKAINAGYSRHNRKDLVMDLILVEMLQKKYVDLDGARQALKKALDSPLLSFFKYMTAGIASIIFFSGGFFAGQTVAMAFAGLFLAVVTPTFWPVLVASFIVGIAALSMYWFVERPAFEMVMGRWIGLDAENIDKLCDEDKVKMEECKLLALKEKLHIRYADLNRIHELEEQFADSISGSENDYSLESSSFDDTDTQAEMPFNFEIENSTGEEKPRLKRALSFNSFFKPFWDSTPVINEDDLDIRYAKLI